MTSYNSYNILQIEDFDFSENTLILSKKIIDNDNLSEEYKQKIISQINIIL
jgi:hypothetical protein